MAKKNLASKALSLLLALMLVVSCANITVLAARPGDDSDSTSVDHIDIGVSLTADIVIDGVLYEDLTYTLNRSDLTADNLKVYSSQGGHTYSLGSVSTSTGSSGIQQFRISGNFPVGTINNPNYYTVELSKTITVTTPSGNVTLPVVFTASFQYWDTHNDCPGLRNGGGNDNYTKWQQGSVIGGSGLDFLLGNAEADLNTKGTLSIQKTVSGLELAEGESKTYTFDIYSADGKLYDTVSVTIGSDSTIGLASISEVPYGTYYIVERDASAAGYTLVTTYTVGDSTTSGKSADIALNTDNPNGAAQVTNAYTPIPVDISVTKVWDDNGNPDRPAQVTVQLMKDNQPQGNPVALNANNQWSYTWTGLNSNYDWSVTEVNAPAGYTVTVSGNDDGTAYTITNFMDYTPPTEPTEPETEPTEPETEPTEPETEPTEPETEPTEPETEPTEPETEPTEPETEPTEPETEPTEPETEPTEPETEPTEPETEPTEPETEPTEPETEPTEPETEPTEPETEPTETTENPDDFADVPQTGSALLLWIAMGVFSGTGLVLTLKKKED